MAAEPGAAALPFVAGPPGSVEVVLQAATRAARHWRLPDPTVLRMGINGVFGCGAVVLRVSRPTAPAGVTVALARLLADRGVRAPVPWTDEVFEVGSDGLWVTAWRLVRELADVPVDWAAVGAMVRIVHDLDPADLPDGHPLPWSGGFPWWHFDERLDEARAMIEPVALRAIEECIERDAWVLGVETVAARNPVVCHGDVHPGNVLVDDDGPVLLDWDLLCWGLPAWDHAPLMTWAQRWGGSPGLYDAFASGYGRDLRDDPAATALARLRLVAATFGRVDAARTDPAARDELERRLRYWRGDPDAPAWRAM